LKAAGFGYTSRNTKRRRLTLLHVERNSVSKSATRQNIAHYAPYALSILRIVAAILFFEHGTSRLFAWPSPLPPPGLFSLHWFAGAIELIGGAVLLVGIFSRSAAFIMSGEMAFAYFLSHAPHAIFPILNRGDSAILYCFVFLYLAFAGPGPWSLDALWSAKRA
jgi:putative oxidoreductase